MRLGGKDHPVRLGQDALAIALKKMARATETKTSSRAIDAKPRRVRKGKDRCAGAPFPAAGARFLALTIRGSGV